MEFSIKFDVDIAKNPLWKEADSNILFPPVHCENQVQVFFKKHGEILKIFIIIPALYIKKFWCLYRRE